MGRYKTREVHKYSEEALANALRAVRVDGIKIREASRQFGVPRGTIQDRIHGRVKEGPRKMGPNTILSKREEDDLEEWLIELAKCGFPKKKYELLKTVQKIVTEKNRKTPFKQNRPGEKWYQGFLRRHRRLSLREAEGLSKARSIISEEIIRKWFRELEQFLAEKNAIDILGDPSRIFNGDETSFSMCPKTGRVLAPKGYKNIYEVKKGAEKETITVLLVFSADGRTLTPMVVFPFVRPNKALVDSVPSGWFLGRSESGWMKSNTFFEYIANGLDRWLDDNSITRPILLLVDGHKSHMSLELSQFCHDHQIILYALPPNTTHLMQPADVSVFKPLKTAWKKTVREWQALPKNVNCVLTKATFCPLIKQVIDDETMSEAIKNGFRKCGLYPYNPDAVDYSKCIQNRIEKIEETLNKQIIKTTEEQFLTTVTVLKRLKHQLTDRGVTNVEYIIEQLNELKKESFPENQIVKVAPVPTELDAEIIVNASVLSNGILDFDDDFDFSLLTLPNEIISEKETALLQITDINFNTLQNENDVIEINETENIDVDKVVTEDDNDTKKTEERNINPNIRLTKKPEESFSNIVEKHKQDQTQEIKVINTASNTAIKRTDNSYVNIEPINKFGKDKDKNPKEHNNRGPIEKNNHIEGAIDIENDFIQKNTSNENIEPEESDEKEDVTKKSEPKTVILQKNGFVQNNTRNKSEGKEPEKSDKDIVKKSERKAIILQNIVIHQDGALDLQTKNKTNDEVFKPHRFFSDTLLLPSPLPKSAKRKNANKLPAAISSDEFRKQLQEKENLKQKAINEKFSRKEERRKRLLEKKETVTLKKKLKITKKKSTDAKLSIESGTLKKKQQCASCDELLESDAEDNDLKNIGCDKCPKWYHLKCTQFQGTDYNEICDSDFICEFCSCTSS